MAGGVAGADVSNLSGQHQTIGIAPVPLALSEDVSFFSNYLLVVKSIVGNTCLGKDIFSQDCE